MREILGRLSVKVREWLVVTESDTEGSQDMDSVVVWEVVTLSEVESVDSSLSLGDMVMVCSWESVWNVVVAETDDSEVLLSDGEKLFVVVQDSELLGKMLSETDTLNVSETDSVFVGWNDSDSDTENVWLSLSVSDMVCSCDSDIENCGENVGDDENGLIVTSSDMVVDFDCVNVSRSWPRAVPVIVTVSDHVFCCDNVVVKDVLCVSDSLIVICMDSVVVPERLTETDEERDVDNESDSVKDTCCDILTESLIEAEFEISRDSEALVDTESVILSDMETSSDSDAESENDIDSVLLTSCVGEEDLSIVTEYETLLDREMERDREASTDKDTLTDPLGETESEAERTSDRDTEALELSEIDRVSDSDFVREVLVDAETE